MEIKPHHSYSQEGKSHSYNKLSRHLSNVYCSQALHKMLLNRTRNIIDPKLTLNQADFRKSRRYIEQVHILRRIIGEGASSQLPLILVIIDYRKALDSIDMPQMFKILRHYNDSRTLHRPCLFCFSQQCDI